VTKFLTFDEKFPRRTIFSDDLPISKMSKYEISRMG